MRGRSSTPRSNRGARQPHPPSAGVRASPQPGPDAPHPRAAGTRFLRRRGAAGGGAATWTARPRQPRPHAPPIEQLSALLLAQPRCPLVGLRKRLVHPLVADHHLVNGRCEENGALKEFLETRSVRWSFEAEGCPLERKRFQQQLT